MSSRLVRVVVGVFAGFALTASLAACSGSNPSAAGGTSSADPPSHAPSPPVAASPSAQSSVAPSPSVQPTTAPSAAPSPTTAPSPTVPPSPTTGPPSPTAPPSPPTPPSPTTDPSPTGPVILRVGDKGPEVADLQRQLASMGFYVFPVDGTFGDDTMHAVIAFQKANRIGVDGAVGPETRAALKNPVPVVAKDTSPGHHVEVDIDRQILMFVWNGKVTHVFDTSTGGGYTFQGQSGDTILAHTPRGHFTIERKIDGDHTSFLGEMWRPSYFYGGYAIHGDSSVPTYPASHGCVRLTNDVTNWAFDRLPIGTPVYIYPND